MQQYDIILAGAGLAGLSTALAMAEEPAFASQRIALIDREDKTRNDRTWCFWATPEEVALLPPVLFRTWPNIQFYSPTHSERLKARNYAYQMVRGHDFYAWAKQRLAQFPNITWIKDTIQSIQPEQGLVVGKHDQYTAQWVLNSALSAFPLLPHVQQDQFRPPFTSTGGQAPAGSVYLLQHFKGWVIRTAQPAFDPETVTFMDFRVPQHNDTRFVYVLPFSTHEALVEYTLFSPQLLDNHVYLAELDQYIRQYIGQQTYTVEEEEFGIIPMTDHPFGPLQQGREIRIGTVGGLVKPSSGYAFKRTQERTRAFVRDWAKTGQPNTALLQSRRRFRTYDAVFLQALTDGKVPAHRIFGDFFKNLGGYKVFRFLDERSNLWDDFRALSAVPTWPFLQAALKTFFRFFSLRRH